MRITGSILDYIGKYEGGILVSVGLMYNDKYYDSIFYYTSDQMIITVDDKMINDLGHYIEEDDDYLPLMENLINQCELHENMIDKLDEIISSDDSGNSQSGE